MPKTTWLSPYMDLWAEKAGVPAPGPLSRAMKPIEAAIGFHRALAALDAYLLAGHGKFGPQVFARAWREWDDKARYLGMSDQERRSMNAAEAFELEGE